jgi:aminoglycoside phosphotransferase (APT) family kinase protein
MEPSVTGVDERRVSDWLQEHVGAVPPLRYHLIAGGHSNLTYRVDAADGQCYVVRRPPLGHLLASAHDVGREFRIISALARTPVPVAPALGLCDDNDVNGAPFYVMRFVDGLVVRGGDVAETLDMKARAHAGPALVDTLASLHAVVPADVGLDDLGRHEGYIARQLKRWYGQWNQSKSRELASIDTSYEYLAAHAPEQGPASIVHGDYRLDNCMIDTHGDVMAVLDWEICTLGDPLADVGMLMVYWTGPDDEGSAWAGSASTLPGFVNRNDLLTRYAEASGRDVSGIDYYVAFALWKLACILDGVYARYVSGASGLGSDREMIEGFKRQVEAAAAQSAGLVERLR